MPAKRVILEMGAGNDLHGGDYTKAAIRELKRALELGTNYRYRTHVALGILYKKQRKKEDAMSMLRRAIDIHPVGVKPRFGKPNPYYLLAEILQEEDREEAPRLFLEVRDAWGHNIAYVLFASRDAEPRDDFLPDHRNPFFASAGPDGWWGKAYTRSQIEAGTSPYSDWDDYVNNADNAYRDSRDNLYSFDLDRTAEAVE